MSERQRHKFGLHCCALDSECRGDIGWCWRLQLNTPWWHLGIALRRNDQYCRLIDREAEKPLDKSNLKYEWTYFQRH